MNRRPLLALTTALLVLAISAPALAAAAPTDPSSGAMKVNFRVSLQGHEGQPSATEKKPLTLFLRRDAVSQVTQYLIDKTDEAGIFTVAVEGKTGETITWRINGSQTLAASGEFMLVDIDVVDMGTLKTGDANNDNVINTTDFGILRSTYGKGIGNDGYDERADFTGDDAVNIRDFNLLSGNFGKAGAPHL